MPRNVLTVPFALALACSCASAPTKPPAAPAPAAPKVAAASPAPEISPESAPPTPVVSRPKLAAGKCEESFDCVDTVGLPPAGQRWTCVDGKCGHARLPELGADPSQATPEVSADNSKDKPKTRKSRKRHN
jgi:hypothetical protein